MDPPGTYSERQIQSVRLVYVLGAAVWLILIVVMNLITHNAVGVIILMIPFALFALSYFNIESITPTVEQNTFSSNFLSLGLILVFPILTWVTRDSDVPALHQERFMSLLVLSIGLTMLSLLDIWVPEGWIPITIHIKSIFQTLALTLLLYALYSYYIERLEIELHPSRTKSQQPLGSPEPLA